MRLRLLHRVIITFCLTGFGLTVAFAKYPPGYDNPRERKVDERQVRFGYRADCAASRSEADMSINNVRARLLGGGDVWWDLSVGKYIVPKVDPASGLDEVSSIFAGAVWLGGYDPVGNLKLAAQTFRSANANDFWPGPLDRSTGTIERDTCARWDKHFRVLGDNIRAFIRDYNQALEAGIPLEKNEVPEDVLGWPATGNPYFSDIHGFDLPNTSQGLAGFFDADGDFVYDPVNDGDYPIIEIRGCPTPQYPDEMIFWIYNDAGGIHTQTQGSPIQMEIQVQAFAYATNDEINDMTFQRYKLINRATQSIDSTFFAMWVDPDLGCSQDDYIGCDTARSLAYVYNEDQVDGTTGCDCEGTPTYCEDVPILGVDYFRGPLDENGQEIGMSSFTYFNNAGVGQWPNAQTDPEVAQEYYNYMSGSWKDGTPFSQGGDAFNIGGSRIDYAFTEAPNNPTGWSMCTANLPFGDRRTIQASGPFRLDPGATNELIIGVVWVPDITDYPCPSIDPLIFADETAQALFDNCFDITDGPDAPDLDFVELDRELICILTNDQESNNFGEEYEELDLRAPTDLPDEEKLYKFEGYKVYQLNGPEVSTAELDDPDKARLIFQTDIKNGISQIVNWEAMPHPTESGKLLYEPVLEVMGENDDIRHSFRITEDQFSKLADRTLINHQKYYFTAVAYAHNEFEPFNSQNNVGQRTPYLEGRRNIKTYVPTPRPIVYESLNASYGDGPSITRLDGVGAGNTFLELSEDTRAAIVDGSFNGEITYERGAGPITVQIYNPLEVVEGEFRLSFTDSDMDDEVLDQDARWTLIDLNDPSVVIASETSIARLNEQIIGQYGFSVSIGQTEEAGDFSAETNGSIGSSITYEDINDPWLSFVADDNGFFNFARTDLEESEFEDDPQQLFTNNYNGIIPFYLSSFRFDPNDIYISPAWIDNTAGMQIVKTRTDMSDLNNVDIVLTSDKSKWSRCVVVETASPYYFNAPNLGGAGFSTVGNSKNFDLRNSPSVGKEDSNNDGLPDPDGDGFGMGWFPGYAIDVETGQRLNIFFGENSVYRQEFFDAIQSGEEAIGADMMWNPDERIGLVLQNPSVALFHTGGQHFIYVTRQPYDECLDLRERLDPGAIFTRKYNALRDITWTGIPVTDGSLLSYAEGLIPNEATIKLRVSNPYQVAEGTGENDGHPSYRFTIEGQASEDLIEERAPGLLDLVNVVPNPYLAYSVYETSQFTNIVKITNLPPRCIVTIYSLDGKFIRQYRRDEAGIDQTTLRSNPGIRQTQVTPDIEWNLKNSKGIPIAGGVYLIHINGYELGERTIKWFGVNRKFDPSGL